MSDTIEQVKTDLGLTGPDAAVYVHLCVGGAAKVSDLAEALHMHRNDVYRTTERLLERGLVQATVERPARFVAVPPTEVFDHEIENRLAAVENLRKSRTEVMALVEQLQTLAPSTPKGVYKILQGRPTIYAHRDHMLMHAKESIQWVTSHVPALKHAEVSGTLGIMAQRAADGIHFDVLVRTTPATKGALEQLRGYPNVAIREFECDVPVRFLLIDGKELLMFVVNDPSDSLYAADEVAIYTTAAGFVAAQQQFLQTSWAASRPMPSF